jgi:hypothetical protein
MPRLRAYAACISAGNVRTAYILVTTLFTMFYCTGTIFDPRIRALFPNAEQIRYFF